MRNWLFGICIFYSATLFCQAEKPTFTIGTQSISYKPHYDFNTPEIDSLAEAILQLFATEQQIRFTYVPLPIKRLNVESGVDFVYPDNPLWREAQNHQSQLFFSQPLVFILGGTMVKNSRKHMLLSELKTVAVPRGFTPEHLLKAQSKYQFELVETSNAESAIKMVLKGRVDAADVELNVANFLLEELQQPGALVPGTNLPFTRVGFHISSARHPKILLAFDRFLITHRAQITQLKRQYGLKERMHVSDKTLVGQLILATSL